MLLELLTGYSSYFRNVNQLLPAVGDHMKAVPLLPEGGRLIKTHEPYRKEYKKAVYLLRDPRDVALSEHAYEKGLGRLDQGFDDFLRLFLAGQVNGYGSWQGHVNSWLDADLAGRVELLIIGFEQLRQRPEETLRKILEFIGFRIDLPSLTKAIANNSLAKMKAKEDSSPQMPKGGDRFVRSGAVGGWVGKLTPAQVELVEKDAGDTMVRVGYSLHVVTKPREKKLT